MIVYTNKHKIPFIIDDEDYERVKLFSWHIHNGYVTRSLSRHEGDGCQTLHLFLLGYAPNGLIWDHENQNKLDNRRKNIRAVTISVNARNSKTQKENTGIHYDINRGKYVAQIRLNKIHHWLGYHDTLEAALEARKEAEIKLGFKII